MKIKNFILAALAAVTLSACATDKGPNQKEGGAKGYLALTLKAPETKTTGNTTENGIGDENTIGEVTIVLTSLNGTINHVHSSNNITNGTVEKILVELGSYYVYALVNNPVAVQIGENIEQVVSVNAAAEATSGFKSGNFFMTNARHNGTATAGIPANVTPSNTAGNPAQVEIRVDRVAVKIENNTVSANVDVSSLTTNTNSLIDGVDVQGFVVLNVNKKFNMIQTWNNNNPNGDPLSSPVLSTPLYSGPPALVKDQYYHNISEYATILRDGTSGEITSITDLLLGQPLHSSPVYATENRPTIMFYGTGNSLITAGRGETTGVIYKVVAQRGGAPMPTFYKYKDVIYEDVFTMQGFEEFNGIDLANTPAPQLRALGIKVFENGVMYYTYFILDPNTNYTYNSANYYGVFRNSIYRLAINSISDLGDDIPGGGTVDPEQPGEPGNPPIDTEEAYIEVSVIVNPWILNVIGIDL